MAATDRRSVPLWRVVLPVLLVVLPLRAAVLPEDRIDAALHSYDGGGVEVKGPALLLRKTVADRVSLEGGYYSDLVSAASPDVLATASPFTDRRDEWRVSARYLHGDSILHLGYTSSTENDYDARTWNFGISHEFFGGMSTLTLDYTNGANVVRRSDNDFRATNDRSAYRLGLAQVLSPSTLLSLSYEGILDEGYLSNPYRSVRILGIFAGPERYPGTRTSNAIALRLQQYFDFLGGGALSAGYRHFSDTWQIGASDWELGWRQHLYDRWMLGLNYRQYAQTAAVFYSDDFDREYTYMARDKELSTFSSRRLGLTVSYDLYRRLALGLENGRLVMAADWVRYDYQDYTDASKPGNTEPYGFDALLLQINFTSGF